MTKRKLIEAIKDMHDDVDVVLNLSSLDKEILRLADGDSVWTDFNVLTSGTTHEVFGEDGMIWLKPTTIVMG